ncbi:hypothetical protein GCM10027456_25020 [Kineosporia babensis]
MAYTKPAAAQNGTTQYDAARDSQMNNGIEAAAAVADQAAAVAAAAAPLTSPDFAGSPTAPTAAPGTSSTQLATTAFVAAAVAAVSPGPGGYDGGVW